MQITSVHHIHFQFPAKFKEELRFFYGTVLGAQELPVSQKRQLLQFSLGEQLLCFTPEANAIQRSAGQHVAFNIQGMAYLKERLRQFGLHFIESAPAQQAQQLYVKDPAGNQLEFLEGHLDSLH